MTEQVNMDRIGNLIKKLRLSKNLTQEQLAGILNVSKVSVCKWENGEGASTESLFDVCRYFRIDIDDLLNGEIKKVDEDKIRRDFLKNFSAANSHTNEEYVVYLNYLKDNFNYILSKLPKFVEENMNEKDEELYINLVNRSFQKDLIKNVKNYDVESFRLLEKIYEDNKRKLDDKFYYELSQYFRLIPQHLYNSFEFSDSQDLVDAFVNLLPQYEKSEIATSLYIYLTENLISLKSNKLFVTLIKNGTKLFYNDRSFRRTNIDQVMIDCVEFLEKDEKKTNAYEIINPSRVDATSWGIQNWKLLKFDDRDSLIDEEITKKVFDKIISGEIE